MILGPDGRPLDTNGRPMAAKYLNLNCNGKWAGLPCRNQATRAMRLIVPPVDAPTPEYRPLRRFTDLHCCDHHIGKIGVTAEDLLRDRNMKRDFEAAAKKSRPLDFKCDFERAFLEPVLTTTPEYRQFLQRLDTFDGVMKLREAGLV